MYCQNCGHEIPDGAKFCDNCGAPVMRTEDRPEQKRDQLKFVGNMVGENGKPVDSIRHHVETDSTFGTQKQQKKKNRRSGKGLFIVLCVAIVALSAGIAWEVFTLIEVNRTSQNFTLPKLQTESTLTEAGSDAESTF